MQNGEGRTDANEEGLVKSLCLILRDVIFIKG